jgi:hypothetical protein
LRESLGAARKDLKEKKFTTSLVNPTTNKAERLELPAGVQALAAMPDEKSFVAKTYDAKKGQSYLDLIGRDGKRIDRLTEVLDREIGFIFRAPVLRPAHAPPPAWPAPTAPSASRSAGRAVAAWPDTSPCRPAPAPCCAA